MGQCKLFQLCRLSKPIKIVVAYIGSILYECTCLGFEAYMRVRNNLSTYRVIDFFVVDVAVLVLLVRS